MKTNYHSWHNLYNWRSVMSEAKSKKLKKKKNGIAKSSSTKNEVQGGVNSGSETETPEQENLIMVGGIAGYSEEVDSRLTFDEFRNKTQPKDNTRSTN